MDCIHRSGMRDGVFLRRVYDKDMHGPYVRGLSHATGKTLMDDSGRRRSMDVWCDLQRL